MLVTVDPDYSTTHAMVSFAPPPRALQISFHLHGQKGAGTPISELDYSREELEPYMTALLQDYRAFQGGGDYADHMLPGFRIRYDDMAGNHLTGVALPDNVPYIRGQPDDAVFLFTIVFSAGEVDSLVRSIMAGFKEQGLRYTPVPAPPYCILTAWTEYITYIDRMAALHALIRGYAMAWHVLHHGH